MQITPQEKHNFAYYQLVSEEDDFIGMVAYTIYKQAKIEYIERYKAEHSVAPDDKALHEFQVQQCGETNIKSHRKHAEELMNAFLTAYLEENEKDLVDREKKNHEKELRLSTKNSEINAKSRELDEKDKTIKKREREVERREKKIGRAHV